MKVSPLQDCLLIRIEPASDVSVGGIILPDLDKGNPLRFGEVLSVGPGRQWGKRFVPTEIKVGEIVVFHMANLQTKQGRQLCYLFEEDQGLIRETDIFFVVPPEERPRLSL